MSSSLILSLLDEGPGNQSYLVDLGGGRALALDPSLDLRLLDATSQARGLTGIVGELAVGVDTWGAAGEPVVVTPMADPATVDPATVVDVRQCSEYAAGHVPGARNVELGVVGAATLPDGPLVTMCGHSERASTAASVLERTGRSDVRVLPVGPNEWAQATQRVVEVTA